MAIKDNLGNGVSITDDGSISTPASMQAASGKQETIGSPNQFGAQR